MSARKRGCVCSPSSWPCTSTCGGSTSRNTENYSFNEPALSISKASDMFPASNLYAIFPFLMPPRYKSVRPDPVGELRPVGPVLMRVGQVVEDGVFHLLLQMGSLHPQLRDPIDHVDRQVKA